MHSLPSPLPKLCVALGLPTPAQLTRAAEAEYKDGNHFLELRLDHLADPASGIPVIETLSKRYSDLQILATCRGASNGGQFAGDVSTQLEMLSSAGKAGAIAVDVEIESAERAKNEVAALRAEVPVLVSFHDFDATPALAPILRRLRKVPADAYKVVVTAHKPTDNLRLLQFLRECDQEPPLVAMAMSETGTPTRILAPLFGSLYTYAAPSSLPGTAPGQLSASQMRSLYLSEKHNRKTLIYGIIADPVAHTKSPFIHNRAFQSRRLNAVYIPFLVQARRLGEWMRLADAIPISGFSVTIPHKQSICRHLDVIDPLARRIGAVNTVWRKGGKWRGTNTDVDGVMKPLSSHLRLRGSSILIAGYGGAARAAAIGLHDAGANVTVTGRNQAGAASLARLFHAATVTLEEASRGHYDALVHATPVGMSSGAKGNLFPRRIPAGIVLDMVYNPRETPLLKRAKAEGLTVIYGAEMLLEQAARQFEIWTGENAPRAAMSKALDHSLAS